MFRPLKRSVIQINKKIVALTAEFVLLETE
jgi:hypothetical protein